MKNQTLSLLIILSLYCLAHAYIGVDLSQLFPLSAYQCMKSNNIEFVIPRGYCSYGGVDKNIVQNLQNAKAAQIPHQDMYMFPCVGKSASAQAAELVAAVPSSLYGMIWIDVETNPSSGCGWSSSDFNHNCQFMTEVVSALQSHGVHVGIYASHYMWQTIFGASGNCAKFTSIPIWYAHYDNNPSFSDWTSFGGWAKPAIKQYKGTTSYCGASVDMDFY